MDILVLGDSHTFLFSLINSEQYRFDICYVSGATAQGMVNSNSSTNALCIFREKVSVGKRFNKILIMLGEVDCAYLIWVRSSREGIDIDAQIDLCVKNLFDFIKNTLIDELSYNCSDIIVLGAHLPAIRDDVDRSLIAGARAEVDASQYLRTQKTLLYNSTLQEASLALGCKYIDITSHLIGGCGVIKDEFLCEEPGNFHIRAEMTSPLWLSKLVGIL